MKHLSHVDKAEETEPDALLDNPGRKVEQTYEE